MVCKWRFWICMLVALLTLSWSCLAQHEPLQVELKWPEALEYSPPENAMLSFDVQNSSTTSLQIREVMDLPEGWQVATPLQEFMILADCNRIRLHSLQIPTNTLPGTYQVSFSLEDVATRAQLGFTSMNVEILPITGLDLILLSAPRYVLAGESYEVSYLLFNTGNHPTDIKLETSGQTGFTLSHEKFVQLSPGQSRQISVTVQTSRTLTEAVTHRLNLKAISGSTTVQARSTVEILSSTSGQARHTYPLRFETRLDVGQSRSAQLTSTLAGRDYLDELKTQRLDLKLHVPWSSFGQGLGDSYIDFQGPKWGFYLGRKSYGTSRLTRSPSSDAGVAISHLSGSTETVVQIFQRAENEQLSIGVGLAQQRENVGIEANYVKHPAEQIISTGIQTTGAGGTTVALETAAGIHTDGNSGVAGLAKLDGTIFGGQYDLSLTYGQEGFPGLDGNTLSRRASVYLPLYRTVRIGGSYNDTHVNTSLRRTYGAHITAPISSRGSATLSLRNTRKQDLESLNAHDTTENRVGLRVGQRFSKVYLSGRYEWVTTHNQLLGTTINRDTLRLAARFYPQLGYGGGIYYTQAGLTTGHRVHTLGASANLSLTEISRLIVGVQHETGLSRKTTLEANIVHRLRDNFELKAQLKSSYSNGTWDTTGMVQGTVYFGVPAAKRVGLGAIRGRVYDGRSASERGLPGAIVRAGSQVAVTDQNGSFELVGLQPGEYYLQIDGSSLVNELIPGIFMGEPIILEADQVVAFDVPMVQKASIAGKVESEGIPRFSGSVAGFVVQVRQGNDSFTTVSDRHGDFNFTDLYPGEWEILVNPNGQMETTHMVDVSRSRVNLEAGSSADIAIRVVPQSNGVPKIIGGGTLTAVKN